jgi:hypothetical protein
VCESNEAVDAAYTAAISSGGIDQGKPADRTYFAPGYYAANVADFDGNRLEFVHKAWNPPRQSRLGPSTLNMQIRTTSRTDRPDQISPASDQRKAVTRNWAA